MDTVNKITERLTEEFSVTVQGIDFNVTKVSEKDSVTSIQAYANINVSKYGDEYNTTVKGESALVDELKTVMEGL